MQTVGWIFFEETEQSKFDACAFQDLNFMRFEDMAYKINVPCLTLKEMNFLNKKLPKEESSEVKLPGVPPSDIERYSELYRYFPTFAEAVLT